MFCSNCGANVEASANFCGRCGSQLSGTDPVPTTPRTVVNGKKVLWLLIAIFGSPLVNWWSHSRLTHGETSIAAAAFSAALAVGFFAWCIYKGFYETKEIVQQREQQLAPYRTREAEDIVWKTAFAVAAIAGVIGLVMSFFIEDAWKWEFGLASVAVSVFFGVVIGYVVGLFRRDHFVERTRK